MSYKSVKEILNDVFDSSDSVLKGIYKTEGEVLNMVTDETGDPALKVRIQGLSDEFYTKSQTDALLSAKLSKAAMSQAVGNLAAPLTHLPLKKNLLTAQGQSICTFTRASAATYTDRYGTLKTAAADTPRFTADGLLIEGASTNLLTYSEQFDNAAWTKLRSSVSANTTEITDPYGTNLADKLIEDTTATITHLVSQIYSFTTGTTYTFSVYAKAGSRSQMALRFGDSGLAAGFDLSSGTVLSASAGITTKITALTNGWYKVSATETAVNSGSYASQIQLMVSGATSYTGDGTSGLYIFGAQLEAMPFATSYIATTTASATRAAAGLGFPLSENTPFKTNNNKFSILCDIVLMSNQLTQHLLNAGSGSSQHLAIAVSGGYVSFIYAGATISAPITTGSHRIGAIADNNTMYLFLDGMAVATRASGTVPLVYNTSLSIGRYTSSLYNLYGTISNLRIYDRALTETEVYAA